jgi:hypothetical protein
LEELQYKQAVLIEAITELIALQTVMKLIGLDVAPVRNDTQRLVRRLIRVNREIEKHGSY